MVSVSDLLGAIYNLSENIIVNPIGNSQVKLTQMQTYLT